MHWITTLPETSLYGYFKGFATIKEPWAPAKCMQGRFMSLAECKRLNLFKDWNELGNWHWKDNRMTVFIDKETGGCYPEKFIQAWMPMPVRYSETENDTVKVDINGYTYYVELPEYPADEIFILESERTLNEVENIVKTWYKDREEELKDIIRKGLQ